MLTCCDCDAFNISPYFSFCHVNHSLTIGSSAFNDQHSTPHLQCDLSSARIHFTLQSRSSLHKARLTVSTSIFLGLHLFAISLAVCGFSVKTHNTFAIVL